MKWVGSKVPLVVGTIARATTLESFRVPPAPVCHAVEVRLDKLAGRSKDWLGQCKAIEAQGLPVIVTVRLAAEGGDWKRPEAERAGLFTAALENLAAVDIELQSRSLPKLAALAKKLRKTVIVSAHDFIKTPSAHSLRDLILEALPHASIIKLATLTKTAADVATLRGLLAQDWGVPLAVMGMGRLGFASRLELARCGSALTYGWLDDPLAPGQPSAAELMEQLSGTAPVNPGTTSPGKEGSGG
jgi:3-dehydroquinate dehydratase-1